MSAKDTFESGTFLADSFACGTWRGIGGTVVPTVPGLEYEVSGKRMHYATSAERSHYKTSGERMHYSAMED